LGEGEQINPLFTRLVYIGTFPVQNLLSLCRWLVTQALFCEFLKVFKILCIVMLFVALKPYSLYSP